jgi:FkbH-like protein
MQTFLQLKKNLKKDFSSFQSIKVAILGDSATQFLAQAIRGTGYNEGLNLQIFEADFNQIERQILDPESELYQFQPDVILVFYSSHKLLGKYNKQSTAQQIGFAQQHFDTVQHLLSNLRSQSNARIIYFNHTEINDAVFGNFATKQESSFLFQIRQLNQWLMQLAIQDKGFFLLDLSSIQNQYGKSFCFQPSMYINTEMVLSIDILPVVALQATQIIGAMYGRLRKCVILDLDNTTWGGIIGDDGIENIQIGSLGIGKAFTEFQYWVKKLKNRGIIVAVCSKNTDHVAREPFEKHPDMVLRLTDIAVFVANWENKADNIRHIQRILNIGFDSMVFLDDNPFERNLVRENIPGISVPELPEDPAEYLEFLYQQNLFETISYSEEDAGRTQQYQVEAARTALQQRFTNEDEFLESLQMVSKVSAFNNFNTPRVSQLSQRSNQFNLRTVRYTEEEIAALGASDQHYTFSFTLEDKFGDNGLICVIILKKENNSTLFIDTWFMSCRVLKRTMENFVTNYIAEFAQANGYNYLKGEYIATSKNEMVKDHYKNLQFTAENNFWILDVTNYENKKCFITPQAI